MTSPEDQSEVGSTAPGGGPPESSSIDPGHLARQLESRVARLETEVRALSDRIAEIQMGERNRKQRALWIRLVLLALLLGGFFFLRARGA